MNRVCLLGEATSSSFGDKTTFLVYGNRVRAITACHALRSTPSSRALALKLGIKFLIRSKIG